MFLTLNVPSIVYNKWRQGCNSQFRHVNSLYTPLNRGSIAIHTCDITFDSSDKINLVTEVTIFYFISKILAVANTKKIIIPAGTYTIDGFNEKIKFTGSKWISPKIDTTTNQFIILEHHTFITSSSPLLFDALGIIRKFMTQSKSMVTNGKYQTKLRPSPKKIALYCEKLDSLHNEIDSQPSMQLFFVDVKNNTVHFPSPPIYLPLSSLTIHHSLHLTLLDENQKKVTPETFNLVLLINENKVAIHRV